MRLLLLLSLLPLVFGEDPQMAGSIPNMENPMGDGQIPMAFDPPVPEDMGTMRTVPDGPVFGNQDWRKNNPDVGKSQYNRICPTLNNEVKDLGSGLIVRYHCDTHPASWDKVNWTSGLASVEQCARLCADRPNCKSSFWKKADATCWVSESNTLSGKRIDGFVHMVLLSNYQSEAQCTEVNRQCEMEKEGYKTQISDCKKDKAALLELLNKQVGGGEGGGQTQTGGMRPEDSGITKELSELKSLNDLCPRYDLKEFETTNSDGSLSRWRIRCNHSPPFVFWGWNYHYCRHNTATEYVKELQDQKQSYKGLWWREVHALPGGGPGCQQIYPATSNYSPVQAVKLANPHHFIERLA